MNEQEWDEDNWCEHIITDRDEDGTEYCVNCHRSWFWKADEQEYRCDHINIEEDHSGFRYCVDCGDEVDINEEL
jgi:hypothetical protein